ncbi:radial spoke head 14 homolog [Microcaecilia unicolor]|uniref:Radial spoke head 14 homolog n=1 Tax=Microcaecilia unicolor TaxID=1415580 RepID=A0A6P7Z8M3_9AMPH|nr:radial spoke head 14 homolog [Microcaecilia unicolor]
MAHTRISPYWPPNIDPTKAPIAFGERALPKLKEELHSPELLTRQRALRALTDLVHDPEFAYQAISIGFLDSLKLLLLDEDDTVRQCTTEVFSILATHNVGRNGFLHSDVIVPLSKLLDDPVDVCRRNVHKAFELLSELPDGSAGLVEAQLVTQLVLKLKTELEEIQELILDTLHFCLQEEALQALSAGAVTVLKEKLSHSSVLIRSKAACALMGITIPLEGKNRVCNEGVIPLLVQLLKDQNAEVRANAAGALMNATVTTQGKYAALHADAITALLPLVNDKLSKVRLNVIKTLTTLSEAPEGRKVLLEHVNLLLGRLNDPSEAVKRATEIAIRVIQWKP